MNKKERNFLIATHGALADGFRFSLEIIAGAASSVNIVQAYLDDNKPIEEELAELLVGAGCPVVDPLGRAEVAGIYRLAGSCVDEGKGGVGHLFTGADDGRFGTGSWKTHLVDI